VSKSFLLVDDDEDLREALAEALDDEGHRVESCVHGADAIAKLRTGGRPDQCGYPSARSRCARGPSGRMFSTARRAQANARRRSGA
jgi:DNA-binding response OmpR family regulator